MLKYMNYQKNKIKTIAISDCYHFRGYRYGLFGNNIYEDYILELHKGNYIDNIRLKFLQRIIGTRSDNFGETLGIELSKKYQNWCFPWNKRCSIRNYKAQDNPDIVCHTSLDGVLVSHINREFNFLENAYNSIKKNGFIEERGLIELLQLTNGLSESYIVLDGNHRISALSVLGEKKVKAKIIKEIKFDHLSYNFWFSFLFSNWTLNDSRKVFNRYFLKENLILKESSDYSKLIYDEDLQVALQ